MGSLSGARGGAHEGVEAPRADAARRLALLLELRAPTAPGAFKGQHAISYDIHIVHITDIHILYIL